MSDHEGIRHVEIGVADLVRSLDFYRDLLDLAPAEGPAAAPGVAWLSAGPALLKLVETTEGDLGGWVNDDLQRGIRHIGFKVGDVDLRAERVRDAGVPFTLPPLDAVGGVRIAFFQDPDGTHLEITSGYLRYHRVASPDLAERERLAALSRPRTAPPVFDHVAVTSADLDAALAVYRDRLGYEVIGQISQDQDPRGFLITYLLAGEAVLEVFTFTAPTTASPWTPDPCRRGFRHVAIAADDPEEAAFRLIEAGAQVTGDGALVDANGALVDVDGVPLLIA
ncbi:VOC family protein [Microbispora hainanensis]|uniref:VOC family protein n=1 Tax=Microbispora TaxID=2005 RepID=UPI001158F10B|nr:MULTISPECIES: VOC family protein [Microbispora]NJP24224.1 VOC family protein [Microbispora sp. CL1-1]TQS15027.1 VOC family protein [Microbispora sp. SCL1-1]